MDFQCHFFCVLLTLFIGHSTAIKEVLTENFFRNDYILLNGSFYKEHNDKRSYSEAREICDSEGAKLFYPDTSKEAETLIEHFKITKSVLVGVYQNKDQKNQKIYTTDDGTVFNQPVMKRERNWPGMTCVMMRVQNPKIIWDQYTCDRILMPFFCKKTQASLQWNHDCNMPVLNGNDYVLNSKLNKCYKLHVSKKTWKKAAEVCKAEMSSLAEVNSQEEADHLVELARTAGDSEVICSGFQLKSYGWMTLSGKTLREGGYPMWAHTQPDGRGQEECGAMAINGRLHDMDCNNVKNTCLFICEHELQTERTL